MPPIRQAGNRDAGEAAEQDRERGGWDQHVDAPIPMIGPIAMRGW